MSEGEMLEELVKEDKQLEFARNAVRRYKKEPVPSFKKTDCISKKQAHLKRHILNVDDISKINYELIKTSPGHIQLPSDGPDAVVSSLKTRFYKNHLFAMNDKFIASITKELPARKTSQNKREPEIYAKVPLTQQLEWLQQIQDTLVEEYREAIAQEKKWFTLKELVLSANAELDLFSSHDSSAEIRLGDLPVSSNPYTKISALPFNKRRKRNLNIDKRL